MYTISSSQKKIHVTFTGMNKLKELLSNKTLFGQFSRYVVIGGLAFVVDFGLFALCLYTFKWHYLLANLAGLVAGLVVNYILSISWAFSGCERKLENKKVAEFAVFSLVGITAVGINEFLMLVMVDAFKWQEMLSKVVAAAIVLMWNFGGRKLILFRKVKA